MKALETMKRAAPAFAVALALAAGFLYGRAERAIGRPEAPAADAPAPSGHDHGAMGPGTPEAPPVPEGEATEWTCSMHPQIRLPGPGRCPICGMDLIPVPGSAAGAAGRVSLSEEAKALARIETAAVERRPVTVDVHLAGKVAWDETRVSRITAWLGGRIERMFVDYTGTRVEKGDHLLELWSPDLLVAQEELLQAARMARRLVGAADVVRASADDTTRAAKEKLRLWGLQDWQVKRILESGRAQKTVTIFAPQSGLVVEKATLQGSYVETGTPIYTIADPSHVWVLLDAHESDLPWIRYGQEVSFDVAALPGRPFRGTVTFVDPQLDPETRTVKVRVHAENPDLALKPEMFVHARLESRLGETAGTAPDLAGRHVCPMHPEVVEDEPGKCRICGMELVAAEEHWLVRQALRPGPAPEPPLVVPDTAPLVTGKRAVVFVEVEGAEEPTYLLREVVLGPRAGDEWVVASGLMEGERVVVEGAFKLDSALQIRGDRSLMGLERETEPAGDHGHEPSPAAPLWTCPMHPDVLRTEPGICPICKMDLVPVPPGKKP